MTRRTFILALAFAILFSAVTYAVTPPFRPSDNVQDPGCAPSDLTCYVTYGVETQSNGTPLYTDTKTINFGSGLTATDNTNGVITVTAAGGAATWGSIVGTLSNQTDLQSVLDAKQATLVSGTNIKTVNGTTILGSGDLVTPTSPITVGTSGNTLYSSGLSGTGQGSIANGHNIFLGINAGNGATSAWHSNFLGSSAGSNATNVSNANFFGQTAGLGATGAHNSNFIGFQSGIGATNARNSNFFGNGAGSGATIASISNLFGYRVGSSFLGNNIGTNNIIIGTNISLPNGTANAINIGGVLFGTNTQGDASAADPYITAQTDGRIGIAVISPVATLDVNGDAILSGTSRYLNFGTTSGSTGYGIRNNGGAMEYKNNAGSWTAFSGGSTLALYRENPSSAITPVVIGGNTVAIGSGSTASGANSLAFGTGAQALGTSVLSLGLNAGNGASASPYSNFIGFGAGQNAAGVVSVNFIGTSAGYGASTVNNSNFIGPNAGYNATGANYSTFIGVSAGAYATNAQESIFIGRDSGIGDTVNNSTPYSWSILLGSRTSTGGFSNSVLLGGSTTGSLIANTAANQFMLAPTITQARFRDIDYTFPSAQAAGSGYVLSNDGNGALSWVAGGGGGSGAINYVDGSYVGQTSGPGGDGTDGGTAGNVFIGDSAGNGTVTVTGSNFLGINTGQNAPGADRSNFIGYSAGYGATNAANSNFIGWLTGNGATGATGSNFFGTYAGESAMYASNSNFFGAYAGRNSANAGNSNFFGSGAGCNSDYASMSNFIGYRAGGCDAGSGAENAMNSIFIGTDAGFEDTVDNTSNGLSSILIGSYTNTGGFSNSIVLGSGTDPNNGGAAISNTAANQFLLAPSITEAQFAGIDYTFPVIQAAGAGYVLTNNGSGVLSWTNVASGGGSTIFETDGVVNGDQTLLNLVAGTGITLVDDGSGNITITASGGGGGSSQWDDVTDGINYAGGFVGIGRTTPAAMLDIQGDAGGGGSGYSYDQITLADLYGGGGFPQPSLDDATFSGAYSDTEDNIIVFVAIDSMGTPDTFTWQMIDATLTYQDGSAGVIASGSGVPITGSPQLLANGISITFDNTTGHSDAGYDGWIYAIISPGVYYQNVDPGDLNGTPTLDDATFAGTFAGTEGSYILVADIDTEDTPDTFEWELYEGTFFEYQSGNATLVDSDTGVPITGTTQTLSNGLTITFGDTTGHTAGDAWGYAVTNNGAGGGGGGGSDLVNARDSSGSTLFKIDTNGNLALSGTDPYINFSSTNGSAGYGFRNNAGVMQFKNSGGTWTSFGGGSGGTISYVGTSYVGQTSGPANNGTDGGGDNNFFIGDGAGAGTGLGSLDGSVFIGWQSGYQATGANYSTFIGGLAGSNAVNASNSNFFGSGAGSDAAGASNSNFFGSNAGYQASASNSNFFGYYAGNLATNAGSSNFLGTFAGNMAEEAEFSNFFGYYTGREATNAAYSNFIGTQAGYEAENAAQSIFIGYNAGYQDVVNNTTDADDFSILLGNNTSTGGFSNSIALGAYATNTDSNQFMVGSATRPIDEMVILGSGSQSCSIRPDTPGVSCSSDENLKTNITDLVGNDTLKNLLSVRTVTYNWNNTPDSNPQTGFIAQDLEKYFPTLVSESSTGYLQVNYSGITPILTKAIQEMNLNIVGIADLERENTWRESLVAWFGSATNGIIDFSAESVRARKEICIDDVCMTKDQLRALLQNQGSTSGGSESPTPDPAPEPGDDTPPVETPSDEVPPTETPTDPLPPSEEPVVEESADPAPEPEPTPDPAPEPEAPSAPAAE